MSTDRRHEAAPAARETESSVFASLCIPGATTLALTPPCLFSSPLPLPKMKRRRSTRSETKNNGVTPRDESPTVAVALVGDMVCALVCTAPALLPTLFLTCKDYHRALASAPPIVWESYFRWYASEHLGYTWYILGGRDGSPPLFSVFSTWKAGVLALPRLNPRMFLEIEEPIFDCGHMTPMSYFRPGGEGCACGRDKNDHIIQRHQTVLMKIHPPIPCALASDRLSEVNTAGLSNPEIFALIDATSSTQPRGPLFCIRFEDFKHDGDHCRFVWDKDGHCIWHEVLDEFIFRMQTYKHVAAARLDQANLFQTVVPVSFIGIF